MKNTIIPAGYRITTVTWENDGDNYNTLVKEGLSKREVEFSSKIVELSKNKRGIGLENEYEPDEEVCEEAYEKLLPIFKDFPDLFDKNSIENYEKDGGLMLDYLIDNLFSTSEHYGLRVIESFKIEYIATPIVMEDVTDQFINNKK